MGYDGGLLQLFRRYDDDRSGSITANEMILMVRCRCECATRPLYRCWPFVNRLEAVVLHASHRTRIMQGDTEHEILKDNRQD